MELTKIIEVQVLQGCCAAFRTMWNRRCQAKEPLLVMPAAEDHQLLKAMPWWGQSCWQVSHHPGCKCPHNNNLHQHSWSAWANDSAPAVIIVSVPLRKYWNGLLLDFHSITKLKHLFSAGNWWVHHLPLYYYFSFYFYYLKRKNKKPKNKTKN